MSKEANGEVRRSSTGAYSTVIRTFEKHRAQAPEALPASSGPGRSS